MSFTTEPTPKPQQAAPTPSANLGMILGVAVAIITIIALVVLIALGKLDSATGIPLIGVLAGVHGGAAVANTSNR